MMFVNVWFIPANDAAAVSSLVAEERTATRPLPSCSYASRMDAAQLGRDTGLANEVLQAVAGRGQRGGVVGVDPGGQLGELRAHAGAIHRLEKGGGGHDEPRWDRKTGVSQLAEVGALPACARDVGRREILEPDDVTHYSRMRHLGGPVQGRTAFPVASACRAHRR